MGPFLESPETFRGHFECISIDVILFVSSEQSRLEVRSFTVILLYSSQHIKRPALQNNLIGVLGMAFRARNVLVIGHENFLIIFFGFSHQRPVSRKPRNFSGAFRAT